MEKVVEQLLQLIPTRKLRVRGRLTVAKGDYRQELRWKERKEAACVSSPTGAVACVKARVCTAAQKVWRRYACACYARPGLMHREAHYRGVLTTRKGANARPAVTAGTRSPARPRGRRGDENVDELKSDGPSLRSGWWKTSAAIFLGRTFYAAEYIF